MTRKEYEKQQALERDRCYEAAVQYRDRPRSLRGNLLRLRMAGGTVRIHLELAAAVVLLLLAAAVGIAWISFSQAPISPDRIRQESFVMESGRLFRGRSSHFSLYDDSGTEYKIESLCTKLLRRKGLESAWGKGTKVTADVVKGSSVHDGSFLCVSLSLNGRDYLTYEEYCEKVWSNRSFGLGFSVFLGALGLLYALWDLQMIRNMDRHPRFICREFGLTRLPPTWEEGIIREEKAYIRRREREKRSE